MNMDQVKKTIKNNSPRWAIRLIRRIYIRRSNRAAWKRLSSEIHDASLIRTTKGILKEMSTFGERYADIIETMCHGSIHRERRRENMNCSAYDPIVICVIKDEMPRLPLFFDYYRRELGIKAFAFLDDHSTDGTREYLEWQADVSLYTSEESYTSLQRVVWINKIVESEGLNRWYLIVDADELFDYPGRETKKIDQLTHFLEAHKQSRVKALMVDMFAPDKLFSDELSGENHIIEVYNRFFPKYYYESANNITGGGRHELFRLAAIEASGPCVTKYPLIRIDRYDFLINSHMWYPREKNKPIAPNAVLRHYKFLPSDKAKYDERIRKGNFHQNSIEYRAYKALENSKVYATFIESTREYTGYGSLTTIPVLTNLVYDGDSFMVAEYEAITER